MKRFYRVMCFVVSLVLSGYLFIHVSYMYRGYTRLLGFYGVEDNTLDVVFFGTSVTFSSFMPMEAWNEYGMASYDYCTNVQFENSIRHSVKEVLKTQSPRLLMIDVAPFIYQHSAGTFEEEQRNLYIKYNIDSMPYSFNRLQLIQEINREIEGDLFTLLYYNFDICRYHDNMPSLKQYNNAYNDVNRGFAHLPKNEGEVLDPDNFIYDDGTEKPLEGYHEVYFTDLLSYVDQLECEVVFYCAPVIFLEGGAEAYGRKNYMKRIIEEKGYVFWDLTTEAEAIGLDYENDFWSANHFDSLGAEKVTECLAKKIVDSYDIPDRRNDERYADWDEDYQNWLLLKDGYNARDRE